MADLDLLCYNRTIAYFTCVALCCVVLCCAVLYLFMYMYICIYVYVGIRRCDRRNGDQVCGRSGQGLRADRRHRRDRGSSVGIGGESAANKGLCSGHISFICYLFTRQFPSFQDQATSHLYCTQQGGAADTK